MDSSLNYKFKQRELRCTNNSSSDSWFSSKACICIEKKKSLSSYILNLVVIKSTGFPGGAVVESLPANAGDAGSSPGLGRSRMPRSRSAREPRLLSLRVWSLCSATRGRDGERPAHRDEEWPPHRDEEWPPLAATRESPRTETKTQHSHTYIHTYIHKKKNVSRQE